MPVVAPVSLPQRRRCLTTGASAAGPQARARTNLRSFSALKEGAARAEPLAGPACRLHARVDNAPQRLPDGAGARPARELTTASIYFVTATNRAPVNRPSSPVSGA